VARAIVEAMPHPYWPLFDLELRTPRLTIRYVDDEHAAALAALAARGIHDPGFMPFGLPWTDVPSPDMERNALRFYWQSRAETKPEHWNINLAAFDGPTLVGTTSLWADDFPVTRAFETGSWLGREHQGHGLGKEMRRASLHLGFVGLGGRRATTAAFPDNGPSLGVTRSLGYSPNGTQLVVRRGEAAESLRFVMDRAHFDSLGIDDVELRAVEGVRELLGLAEA
jgi:RimJ/RimL family protein N-acetyltransferase